MKMSLDDLIEAADTVVVDEYEIDQFEKMAAVQYGLALDEAKLPPETHVWRLECDEDHIFFFTEQEVVVSDTDVTGRFVMDDVFGELRVVEFLVKRPLTLADLIS